MAPGMQHVRIIEPEPQVLHQSIEVQRGVAWQPVRQEDVQRCAIYSTCRFVEVCCAVVSLSMGGGS